MGEGAAREVELGHTVRREDVLHFLGYPPGRSPRDSLGLLLDAEVLPEATALVRAVGAFRPLEVTAAGEVGLDVIDADALVIGLVTIGATLEARVAEHAAAGDLTRATLLDAAGSAAVEAAADRLSARITGDEQAGTAGVSCRLSPGYGRWSLEAQPLLFAALPHEALGVALRPSLMMTPRKSISFAMWLGARERPATGLAGCSHCTLEHCRYRRAHAEPRLEEDR